MKVWIVSSVGYTKMFFVIAETEQDAVIQVAREEPKALDFSNIKCQELKPKPGNTGAILAFAS